MMFERLTRWENNDKDVADLIEEKSDFDGLTEAVNRLAAYEDSGLSPDEVQELAKAKADGRLVVLLCKVGDNVYFLLQELDGEWYVSSPHRITEIGTRGFWTSAFPLEKPNAMDDFTSWSEFGKTVFLTREEAEKAIAEGMK
jgi:hypothetical protein